MNTHLAKFLPNLVSPALVSIVSIIYDDLTATIEKVYYLRVETVLCAEYQKQAGKRGRQRSARSAQMHTGTSTHEHTCSQGFSLRTSGFCRRNVGGRMVQRRFSEGLGFVCARMMVYCGAGSASKVGARWLGNKRQLTALEIIRRDLFGAADNLATVVTQAKDGCFDSEPSQVALQGV